jgi:hypothetical protein
MRLVSPGEYLARGACHGLVIADQLPNHFFGLGHPRFFGNGGQSLILAVATRCGLTQRTNALSDLIHRRCQFGVLLFEHHVQ